MSARHVRLAPVRPATPRGFNGKSRASVIITFGSEGADGLFAVRPHRSRRTYTLALSDVAQIVVERVIRAEVAVARRERTTPTRRPR